MQSCFRAWRKAALASSRNVRFSSSIASQDPSKIRNIAFLAHIGSGKTTLTESVLHATSYLSSAGSVDTGSTTTDFLPAERERGITIQSASIPVRWKDWTFNLIDTPGHVDFGMEVESASRVIDGAVVLMDAVEGVEGQTLGVWRQLDSYSVPTRMIFLNKLDRPGASIRSSIKSILANNLHPNPVLLTLPVASFDDSRYKSGETGVTAIVDLVNWKVWEWEADGTAKSQELPTSIEDFDAHGLFSPSHPLVPELFKAREALIDNLSLLSSDFMDHFLSLPSMPSPYMAIPTHSIKNALRELTLTKEVLPVLCGAALRHIGTDLVLDYAGDILASPVDVKSRTSTLPTMSEETPQVLAWKVGWDKLRGWMTFVRVYSGTVTKQTSLFNASSLQRERIGKLVLLYANKPETVESLPFGSVGVIMGLKHTRTGDTLLGASWTDKSVPQSTALRNITPPPPVISASVVPQSQSDVGPVKEALLALSRTDPSLRVTEDEEEGQTLVHGLGALHLEIVEGRLKDEWGVRCQFGKRRVSYRETLGHDGSAEIVSSRWEKEVGGRKAGAEVRLQVRPLTEHEITASSDLQHTISSEDDAETTTGRDAWDGNVILDENLQPLPHPSSLPLDSPQLPLLTGLASALSSSPHTSLPLSHLHVIIHKVTVDDGAHPSCIAGAASSGMRKAINEAGMGDVMEPYVRVKVDVGSEYVGKVVKDLTEHGGEISDLGSGDGEGGAMIGYPEESVYIPPAWVNPSSASISTSGEGGGIQAKNSVRAVAPLSKMLDYSSRLRALSAGLGQFEQSVEGFRSVPELRRREIMAELGR